MASKLFPWMPPIDKPLTTSQLRERVLIQMPIALVRRQQAGGNENHDYVPLHHQHNRSLRSMPYLPPAEEDANYPTGG